MGTVRVTSQYGEFTLFYTFRSPFSNFYRCSFKESSSDGTQHKFCCVEQYYMYNKALSANDEDAAYRILAESDPKAMKKIGTEIRGFSRQKDDRCEIEKQFRISADYAQMYFNSKFPMKSRMSFSSVQSSYSSPTQLDKRNRPINSRLSLSSTRRKRSSSTEVRRKRIRSRSTERKSRRRSSIDDKGRRKKHASTSTSSSSNEEECRRDSSHNRYYNRDTHIRTTDRHKRRKSRSRSSDVKKMRRLTSSSRKRSRRSRSVSSVSSCDYKHLSRKPERRHRSDSSPSPKRASHSARQHSEKKYSEREKKKSPQDRSIQTKHILPDLKRRRNDSGSPNHVMECLLKKSEPTTIMTLKPEINIFDKHESSKPGCSIGTNDAKVECPDQETMNTDTLLKRIVTPENLVQSELRLNDINSRISSPDESRQIDAILEDMKESRKGRPSVPDDATDRDKEEVQPLKLKKRVSDEKINSFINRINKHIRPT